MLMNQANASNQIQQQSPNQTQKSNESLLNSELNTSNGANMASINSQVYDLLKQQQQQQQVDINNNASFANTAQSTTASSSLSTNSSLNHSLINSVNVTSNIVPSAQAQAPPAPSTAHLANATISSQPHFYATSYLTNPTSASTASTNQTQQTNPTSYILNTINGPIKLDSNLIAGGGAGGAANFANFYNLQSTAALGVNSIETLQHQAQMQHHHQQQQQQQQQATVNSLLNSLMNPNAITPGLTLNPNFLNGDENHLCEYMHQLLEEKEKLKELFNEPFNILLPISAKLLDEEINRIRVNLFQLGSKDILTLPEPVGPQMQLTEKLYVPVKDHPEFNFVGRILGPRGMTAKQLEQETGCKIMVRGKGSMRDKAKEEQMKGKPNWEHLNDELHVLITVEDTKNRAELKIKKAIEEIKKLLVPAPEGEDELKKKQLMELAIINGTYRDNSKLANKMNSIIIPGNGTLAAAMAAVNHNAIRSPPNPIGQPLIISPRIGAAGTATNGGQTATHNILNGTGAQFLAAQAATDPTGLIYTTIPAIYSDPTGSLAASQALIDYQNGLEFAQSGSLKPQRFTTVGTATVRAHPYARVALS